MPSRQRAVPADEPGNRIPECAREAEAELIVTGDRHLPDSGVYKETAMVTPESFPERLPCGKNRKKQPK
jgi:predicted nucleic acid-binding protein